MHVEFWTGMSLLPFGAWTTMLEDIPNRLMGGCADTYTLVAAGSFNDSLLEFFALYTTHVLNCCCVFLAVIISYSLSTTRRLTGNGKDDQFLFRDTLLTAHT